MPTRPLKYDNLAVPLFYETEFTQNTATTDIVTISRLTGATGDFIQCNDNSDVNMFAVGPKGRLRLRVLTTRPTTGLTKGELMLLFHGSTPKLGICYSTAVNGIKLIRLKTKTFGRLTA